RVEQLAGGQSVRLIRGSVQLAGVNEIRRAAGSADVQVEGLGVGQCSPLDWFRRVDASGSVDRVDELRDQRAWIQNQAGVPLVTAPGRRAVVVPVAAVLRDPAEG